MKERKEKRKLKDAGRKRGNERMKERKPGN